MFLNTKLCQVERRARTEKKDRKEKCLVKISEDVFLFCDPLKI